MKFGQTLKNLRKQRELTQTKLADAVGVHLQTVSKWERDCELPDLSILHALTIALDVSLDTLLAVDCENSVNGTFSSEKMGKGICCFRKREGLTQLQLAKNLGVSVDTVSKWERGIILPKVDVLIQIANRFHVAPSCVYYAVVPSDAKTKLKKATGKRWVMIGLSLLLIAAFTVGLPLIIKGNRDKEVTLPPPTPEPQRTVWASTFPLQKGMLISDTDAITVHTAKGEKVYAALDGKIYWDGQSATFYIQDALGYKAVYQNVNLQYGIINGVTVEADEPLGEVVATDGKTALFTLSLYHDQQQLCVTDYFSFTTNMVALPIYHYTDYFCKNDEFYYNETFRGWYMLSGVIFYADDGSDVVACLGGTVTNVYSDYLDGTVITIRCDNGYEAKYQGVSPCVEIGQTVALGQTIGTVGTSGYRYQQFGSHVYFELQVDNKSVYEMDYILD